MDIANKKITRGNPLIMGASVIGNKVNFAITAKNTSQCKVILYDRETGKEEQLSFETSQVIGNVHAMSVEGLDYRKYDYNFLVDGEIVTDVYAKSLSGKKEWGVQPHNLRGTIIDDDYDWEGDGPLHYPFDETIIYRLHVRGFTKHKSAKSKHPGTYLGIVDKIPYFKELGITMIELMPAYEFNEVYVKKQPTSMKGSFSIPNEKLNYWGYTDGYIFSPKASYAYAKESGSEVDEFKYMVKELHKNGIEVSMEFFFPEGTNPTLILDCLHYWVMSYHIDGIHANCEPAVMKMIQTDNLLSDTKIFTYSFATDTDFYNDRPEIKNLANFNDDFMVSARRFLKGDEDMLNTISYKIKANPPGAAYVNYVANHNTFTLFDMVSYDRKYNEDNGENNKDGAVYNYSWNCGFEGETRKKKVMDLRKKQMKNALALVFLSQGVPMIYAGDEMCNSQKGNNNPYCLDNEISWTNWNTNACAKEIFAYTKALIKFRKEHKILHMPEELRLMDYKSYGLPDMSYHGSKAWYPDFSHINRHFSAMYCGAYSMEAGKAEEPDVYVAYNMHWEPQEFGIPSARKKKKWELLCTTDSNTVYDGNRTFTAQPRSVAILIAREQ